MMLYFCKHSHKWVCRVCTLYVRGFFSFVVRGGWLGWLISQSPLLIYQRYLLVYMGGAVAYIRQLPGRLATYLAAHQLIWGGIIAHD